MRPPRARVAIALVLGTLIVGAAVASAQADAGERESALSVLVYHPYPDPEVAPGKGGDPYGVPGAFHPSRDRMNDVYGAESFPTVRVDGVLTHAHPGGNDGTSVEALESAYASLVETRLAEDSPLTLSLHGHVDAEAGLVTVNATFAPRVDVASERVSLEVVLFEDDVTFDGGNGITNHRFTVRHVFQPQETRLLADAPVTVSRSVPLDANWSVEELGVVAFAQNGDPTSPAWRHLEVMQAATFLYADAADGPTVQVTKGALLEMYSATWCPPCFFGDQALERVATTYGLAGADGDDAAWRYFRAPAPAELAAAAALAFAVGVLVWPRRRDGGDAA